MNQQKLSLKTLLGLLFCNLIWSANPAFCKILINDFGPLHTAWFRYAGAFFAFLGFVIFFKCFKSSQIHPPLVLWKFSNAQFKPSRRDWLLISAMSFFTFCYSPLLQMLGLSFSRATDNALIIAIEPLMTVFLAWILLRERLFSQQIFAFLISIVGFFLLSGTSPQQATGNILILISLLGEASYSIFGKKLMVRFSPVSIFGTILTLGFFILTLFVFVLTGPPPFQIFTLNHLWMSLYLGALGTTASYLYWMIALREAPVASLAITLFIQPVFGALWGLLFLNEHLNWIQNFGAFLILIAILVQNSSPMMTRCANSEIQK